MMLVEAAVGIFRFLQYASVSVLFGSALFPLLFLPAAPTGRTPAGRWHVPLLAGAGIVLALSSIGGLMTQTALLAGSWEEGARTETLALVVSTMALGKAAVVRLAAAVLALACLALPGLPQRTRWSIVATFGAMAAASFAWSGHGAATEGSGYAAHLLADIAHSLAAALWIGTLASFAAMALAAAPDQAEAARLHRSLAGFSRLGSWLVATLVLTGLANAVFLVGMDPAGAIGSPYGQLLAFKLVAFAAMLGLAAAHRWLLVPNLGRALAQRDRDPPADMARLRRSLAGELLLAVLILGGVAWMGMLAPPAL